MLINTSHLVSGDGIKNFSASYVIENCYENIKLHVIIIIQKTASL